MLCCSLLILKLFSNLDRVSNDAPCLFGFWRQQWFHTFLPIVGLELTRNGKTRSKASEPWIHSVQNAIDLRKGANDTWSALQVVTKCQEKMQQRTKDQLDLELETPGWRQKKSVRRKKAWILTLRNASIENSKENAHKESQARHCWTPCPGFNAGIHVGRISKSQSQRPWWSGHECSMLNVKRKWSLRQINDASCTLWRFWRKWWVLLLPFVIDMSGHQDIRLWTHQNGPGAKRKSSESKQWCVNVKKKWTLSMPMSLCQHSAALMYPNLVWSGWTFKYEFTRGWVQSNATCVFSTLEFCWSLLHGPTVPLLGF